MPHSTYPDSIEEDEYNPWEDLAETPIIRGGFIDSTIDAQDLGLERLFDINNHIDKCESGGTHNEKPCIDTPSTSTTLNEESPHKHNVYLPSESDDKFSPFTPNTLEYLENEIKKNNVNLDELETVCKNPEVFDDVREKLLDERKYYISQQAKHMNSILEIAKKTEINDVDADRLSSEIEILKNNVDKISKDFESLKHRTLTESNKNNSHD